MKPVEKRAAAIAKRLPGGARVAEIGVAQGNLSEELLRSRSDIHLIMVDNWKPGDEQPQSYISTRDRLSTLSEDEAAQNRAQAIERVKPYGRAVVVESDSVEAAGEFSDDSLDLVFIDADHSYCGAKNDIDAWWPKVKKGGYIGGHDYNNPDPRFSFGVTEAVDEFCRPELDGHYTWFCKK